MNQKADIQFRDITGHFRAHDAIYLGNNLNHRVDLCKEVLQGIADTKTHLDEVVSILERVDNHQEVAIPCNSTSMNL